MLKLRVRHKKKVIALFGYGIGLGSLLVLTLTFFSAYFNDFQILVVVNRFCEAHVEAVFIPVCLVVCILGFIYYVQTFRSGVKQ
jgi:hypothetical protein